MAVSMYDATLRGVALSSLAEEIIVRDIVEMPLTEDRQSAKRAQRPGTMVYSTVRRTLPVKIIFNIRAYDGTRRAEIMDSVAGWVGGGGKLAISTRPGKHLYVKPDKMPRLGSSLKWTDDIELTLTAFAQPYWEDDNSTSLMMTPAMNEYDGLYHAADIINPSGNVGTVPVSVMIFSSGQELTSVMIKASDTMIKMEGISMSNGALIIGYSEDDLLSITINGESVLHHRTAESSDELLVKCGEDNNVSVVADAPVTARLVAKGRWL